MKDQNIHKVSKLFKQKPDIKSPSRKFHSIVSEVASKRDGSGRDQDLNRELYICLRRHSAMNNTCNQDSTVFLPIDLHLISDLFTSLHRARIFQNLLIFHFWTDVERFLTAIWSYDVACLVVCWRTNIGATQTTETCVFILGHPELYRVIKPPPPGPRWQVLMKNRSSHFQIQQI